MYEKAKAETYIFFLGILSLFICILTFAGYHDYMMHGKPLNINKLLYEKKNDLDSKEFVGQYASITLNSSLGSFATEKHRYYFIPTGESTYYLTLLDDNSIMAVKVKDQKDIDTLEKMTSETYASGNFYSKETITLEGKVDSITSGDILKYYDEALVKLGVKDEKGSVPDNKIKMRYVCLNATENRGTLWTLTIVTLVVGVGCIFGDTIVFSIIRKKKQKEQQKQEAQFKSQTGGQKSSAFWPAPKTSEVSGSYGESSGGSSVDSYGDSTGTSSEKKSGGDDYEQEYVQFDELEMFMSDGDFLGENTALDPNRDEEPKFNEPDRHERTDDNKISISGRDIVR